MRLYVSWRVRWRTWRKAFQCAFGGWAIRSLNWMLLYAQITGDFRLRKIFTHILSQTLKNNMDMIFKYIKSAVDLFFGQIQTCLGQYYDTTVFWNLTNKIRLANCIVSPPPCSMNSITRISKHWRSAAFENTAEIPYTAVYSLDGIKI